MQLPVADTAAVRTYAKVLIGQHRSKLVRMLSLYALAAFMALIPAYISARSRTSRPITN